MGPTGVTPGGLLPIGLVSGVSFSGTLGGVGLPALRPEQPKGFYYTGMPLGARGAGSDTSPL